MDVKKVLYISYDGLTDPLGQSQVLPYLKELSGKGYQFTILSFEKKARMKREAPIIQDLVAEAGITWVPLDFTSRPPVLSKIWDRYRMWRKALQLHKQKHFDLVHCRSYVAAEVGLKLKRKYRLPFLFDMRGFWADEKVDNGQWNLDNPLFKKIYKHYKKKEREFLLNADGIVSLTTAGKDYLLQQPGLDKLNIEVIPCCADLDHFNYANVTEVQKQTLRKELGIPENASVMTYLGSVGGWYMMKEMFAFFRLLLQKEPAAHMLVLTKDDPGQVRQAANMAGIGNEVLTVTYADRKRLPVYLSLSKSSIFFIRNSFSKTASSPTKHAELMGMGLPVICNDIGDTGRIVEKTGTGLLVNSFEQELMTEAVDEMKNLDKIDPAHIRSCALNLFDLHAGVRKYEAVYKRSLHLTQGTSPKGHAQV